MGDYINKEVFLSFNITFFLNFISVAIIKYNYKTYKLDK